MALPFRVARAIVGVIAETTPYSFLEPTGAASFHAVNIVYNPSQASYKRKDTRAHFGKLPDIPGAAEGDISFEIPLVGASAAGTVPFWDGAMIACGHQKVVTAATSVLYKPTTLFDASVAAGPPVVTQPSEVYSVAIWDENGGPRYALSGCQGDFGFSSKQGQPLVGKFKFHGAYVAIADDATPPAVTDSTLIPPTLVSAGISVFGVATLAFDGFEFTKANVLSKRADSNQSAGVRGAWITDHNPMIKIEPEMVAIATVDNPGNWRSGALGIFTTGVIGGTAGNRFQFVANKAQINDFNLGEREGARTAPLSLALKTIGTAVSGDDYSLAIT